MLAQIGGSLDVGFDGWSVLFHPNPSPEYLKKTRNETKHDKPLLKERRSISRGTTPV